MEIKIAKLENRIHLLEAGDPVRNAKIINKLKRQLRALKG